MKYISALLFVALSGCATTPKQAPHPAGPPAYRNPSVLNLERQEKEKQGRAHKG